MWLLIWVQVEEEKTVGMSFVDSLHPAITCTIEVASIGGLFCSGRLKRNRERERGNETERKEGRKEERPLWVL